MKKNHHQDDVVEEHTDSREELEILEQKLQEAEMGHLRALADYKNLERRMREDQARFAKLASAGLLEALLEPFDHLELTAKHATDPATKKALEMLVKQIRDILTREGFESIQPDGQLFDSTLMEVAETQHDPKQESDVVLSTVRLGYLIRINDHPYVLRPARVVVNQEKQDQQKKETETA